METYKQGYWRTRFMFYNLWDISPLQINSIALARSKAANRGMKLLDLACGDGRHLFAYNSSGKLHPQDTVIALDISNKALVLTREVVPKAMPIQGSTLLLPFKKDSLDFVLCSMLIEHVPDDMLLHEIRRVLAPGAVLHLTTVIRRPYAPFTKRSPEGRLVLAPNHLREYKDSHEIINLVEKSGFSAYCFKSYAFRVSIIHRLLMLGLKLRLFDLPVKRRMIPIAPNLKKFIKLFTLQVPIIGYYTFEGIFVAGKK
ncbi:MAG: class I SAM-dependent methyltransferase [Thermodesulfobacteriota bacterium]